jgi:hypothetical protein
MCILDAFVGFLLTIVISKFTLNQVKDDEMDRECSKHERDENFIKHFGPKT